jgi:murein hydrolase activator
VRLAIRCGLTAALALLTVSVTFAQQADRARTQALAKLASDRLEALRHEADRLAASERTVLTEVRQLDVQRQIKAEELRRIQAERADVGAQLDVTNQRIARLDHQDRAARPELEARLVEMYKLGQGRYLRLLLSATDLSRVGQASRMVGVLAKLDADRTAEYRRTLDELGTARADLDARRAQLQKLQADAAAAQAALAKSVAARNALIQQIDQQRDVNAQFASALRAAQAKLQRTLQALTAGTPTEPSALPIGPFRGDVPWPVAGPVQRRSDRTSPSRAAGGGGIEIAAAEGSPVTAVHDGLVAFAGSFSGFGNLVILDHGGHSYSLYGDLLDLAVRQGDRVTPGRTLCEVGTLPAGPAGLYFEIRIDGRPVDPLQWLAKR